MSYLPDDCSECRVCGVPILGAYGGVCSNCEIPRDAKGRFVKRPTAPKWPATGDRVFIEEHTRDGYIGHATVVDDREDHELHLGVLLVETETGEQRDVHGGYMKVVD